MWITDGTTGGTSLVKDIYAGTSSSLPSQFLLVGNKVIFSATDSAHGAELWVTDGTGAGTNLLMDIEPGMTSSSPSQFTLFGGTKVLFKAASGAYGGELWKLDLDSEDGIKGNSSKLKTPHKRGFSLRISF